MTLPHGDDHGPPTLVWGRTAWSWTRLAVIGLVGGAISGLGIPAARFLLPQSAWEPSMLAAFGVALGFGALALWSGISLQGAIDREREAGYTTLYGRYWELWQLHPKTGEVLRRPGEREVRRRARERDERLDRPGQGEAG